MGKIAALILFCVALPSETLPVQAQFKQLGPKLVRAGDVGSAFQGFSVALSASGEISIVGDWTDNARGGAWVAGPAPGRP